MYQYNQNLSSQETKCAKHILTGLTAKEIGRQLELSPRTVESYIENIKIKLLCQNKTQLILVLAKMSL
jgi:DNA-binding NarL/FixJ family response regulator